MADSNDVVREAFRTELATILAAASIGWAIKDVDNAFAEADGQTPFVALDFGSGAEDLYARGGTGSSMWDERGQVMVRLFVPVNAGRSPAEGYASSIRKAFRNRRFDRTDGRQIRTNAGPTDAYVDGARWVLTVPVAYQTYNVA